MSHDYLYRDNLCDPAMRALMRNATYLRSYQTDALRMIYDAVIREKGGSFAVTFPRQSGKNETQAQLESAVMAANLHRGGSIIKLIPTEKNQGRISLERLSKTLQPAIQGGGKGASNYKSGTLSYGPVKARCLSASPNAAIVGATADLLLEVDEAQMISPEKFDREAAPMAASTNAVQVFWGTAWDDRTLLARESRRALRCADEGGSRSLFLTDAAAVGEEVPAYGSFVRGQIASLGREHPVIRTQFFCEEISDLTAMFTPERIEKIRGSHLPLETPEYDRCYVFLIDIAGSDELTVRSRETNGFSDRRDATVLTICDVSLPEDDPDGSAKPVWRVVGRRYYRNVPEKTLEEDISREIRIWDPARVILDHSGLGCMLSDALSRRFPFICRAYDITTANKTRMAWEFLAMVLTGRWQEYHIDELQPLSESGFDPRRDSFEILQDPALLQRMFIRELRACRMDPSSTIQQVQWGVPDGTRDGQTGRLIHDDLVMSAALSVLDGDDLPLCRTLPDWDPDSLPVFDPWKG